MRCLQVQGHPRQLSDDKDVSRRLYIRVMQRLEGRPTMCSGGSARAPHDRHQTIQEFYEVGYANHQEYANDCKDIDVVVPV